MRHKLVCESLLEYTKVSGGDSRNVALNLIKRYKDVISNKLRQSIAETSDNFASLPYEGYFDREFDGIQVKVADDEFARSVLYDGYFIIDAKIIGQHEDDEYIFETQSLGIYFTVPKGDDVAEFYDKDELTETGTFITFAVHL